MTTFSEQRSSRPGWFLVRHLEQHAKRYSLLGLAAGTLAGSMLRFARPLGELFSLTVQAYGVLAPLVIYFVLAPSLLKILRQKGAAGSRFFLYSFLWLSRLRLLACALAILLTSLCYGLPLAPAATGGLPSWPSLASAASGLGALVLRSPYFHALFAALVTVALLGRSSSPWVERLARIPDAIESWGALLTRITPLFTFLVGIYLATLPSVLHDKLAGLGGRAAGGVTLVGLRLHSATPAGIFGIYVAIALLTGAICTLWHLLLLWRVCRVLPAFSLARYFRGYFLELYPLLWATSSEAVAMPSSLYLIRKTFPSLDERVRQFTVGAGSMLNINGTMICCFVMIPAVCGMLGLPVSLWHLLLALPVIYLLGFGVPGIPGELVLFAGPLLGVLGVPGEVAPLFLLLFLSLQFGLPDSFRTGANSTDNGPTALLLDAAHRRRAAG
jgi:Na+/serine symporter